MLRREARPRRNERCFCGSGKKYKYCHSRNAIEQPQKRDTQYLDYAEEPIRFVIANSEGTGFFSTKEGKVMVFTSSHTAKTIAHLPEFDDQVPGEINVVGIGPTKWQFFQERLPFIEFADDAQAVAAQCIRDKISHALEQYEAENAAETSEPSKEDVATEE